MSFLETSKGIPPSDYSREFLDIDALSGPWLVESQKSSPAMKPGLVRWELDLSEGVLWLGDEEHNLVVAEVQPLATYSADDGKYLWAWANRSLEGSAGPLQKMCQMHEDVDEFKEPLQTCSETRAWALAAAAAYKLNAETCYRLKGELRMFVALFEVTELAPGDPRYQRPVRDEAKALEALTEYAGASAMAIGGILIVGLKNNDMSPPIQGLYRFAEKLAALSDTPVGKDTAAAEEAMALSRSVHDLIMQLSYPPEHPLLLEGVSRVLSFLEGIARKYGAWPDEE